MFQNFLFSIFRVKDLELELNRLRMENEQLKKSSPGRLLLSSKSDESAVASSSVAKVIQPTATVSSVPVSGPSKIFSTKSLGILEK